MVCAVIYKPLGELGSKVFDVSVVEMQIGEYYSTVYLASGYRHRISVLYGRAPTVLYITKEVERSTTGKLACGSHIITNFLPHSRHSIVARCRYPRSPSLLLADAQKEVS